MHYVAADDLFCLFVFVLFLKHPCDGLTITHQSNKSIVFVSSVTLCVEASF